jgi:capping protein alpha
MPDTDFGRDVMLSLPPMETKGMAALKSHLTKLNAFDDNFMNDLNAKTCSLTIDSNDNATTPLMAAIQEQVEAYQSRYAAKDLTARLTVQATPYADGEQQMTAKTYVEKLESPNCRAGGWSTTWNISPITETKVEMGGTTHVHLHYYEGGSNIQLRATRQYPERPVGTEEEAVNAIVAKLEARNMSYDEKIAKATAKEIAAREKEFYEQMKGACEDAEESLKKMRRILPITKTRFQWNGAAQKQVRLLNDRKVS